MLSVQSLSLTLAAVWLVVGSKLSGQLHPLVAFSTLAPLFTVLLVFPLAAAWQIIYYRFLHPLRSFPGPFWASVTRLWLAKVNYEGREAEEILRLHGLYGPVVRVTPTLLSINQASMLPLIYHREADKTEHYSAFVKDGPQSFFNVLDHKAYVKARKLVSKPFTPSNVKAFEPIVNNHVEQWLTQLTKRYATSGTIFDFAPWGTYLGFDVITDLTFGKPMGFVHAGSDIAGLIKGLHTGWMLFGLLSRLHPLKSYMSRNWLVKRLFEMKPSDKTGFGVLMKTRDRIIHERLSLMNAGKSDGLRRDMLQGLLEARDDHGKPLPMKDIEQEALVILIAGADTVGTTLQTILIDILGHPKALARCTAEISGAQSRGLLSNLPTVAEVHEHCPFFVACLKETLRVHPAAPSIFPRLISEPGIFLGGRFVPPGTEVAANISVLARDKELYGQDAESWNPDRWLSSENNKIKEMNKLSMSWAIDRPCLGKDVALMELCKAGVEVLRRYECRLSSESASKPKWIVKAGVGWWEDVYIELKLRE